MVVCSGSVLGRVTSSFVCSVLSVIAMPVGSGGLLVSAVRVYGIARDSSLSLGLLDFTTIL